MELGKSLELQTLKYERRDNRGYERMLTKRYS
jgi:hypothetical protein